MDQSRGLQILGAALLGAAAFVASTPSAEAAGICRIAKGANSTSVDQVVGTGTGGTLVFEKDGDLAYYAANVAGVPVWSTGTASGTDWIELCQDNNGTMTIRNYTTGATLWTRSSTYGGQDAAIDIDENCDVHMMGGSTSYWSVSGTCPGTTQTNNVDGWCADTSEDFVVDESAYASLEWTGGKLQVIGTGIDEGEIVWTATSTVGAKLCFNAGGYATIYIKNSAGTVIYTYIAYPTPYYNVEKIGLADGCKLTIQGYSGNVVKTMNADCDVAKYTFEDSDGNDVFGSNVTTTMTATAGSPNKTTTTTKVGLVIFGNDTELLSLTAYQTSNNTNKETYGSVTVFGASMSMGFSLSKSETLFEKTYPVGGVPVVVKAGFSGSLSLTASVDSQLQYKVTPALGIYANVSAGVGVSGTVAGLKAGASAGFKGTLALLELSFPVTMTVSSTFTVKGEMTLKMLSGALSLYAEAFVEVAGIKAAVSWTYKLISWTGIESTSTLFSATGKSF